MLPMHGRKAEEAFHGPHGAAGILPAEESEKSFVEETSAAPCWRHRPACSTFKVPRHGIKVVGALHVANLRGWSQSRVLSRSPFRMEQPHLSRSNPPNILWPLLDASW